MFSLLLNYVKFARQSFMCKKQYILFMISAITVFLSSVSTVTIAANDSEPRMLQEYFGSSENGRPHGNGVMIFKKGNYARYEGDFKDGEFHGRGVLIYFSGSTYTGDFKYGKFNGYGELESNHFKYMGQFKDGTFHGKGTYMKKAKGTTYTGYFKDGKPHGKGMMSSSELTTWYQGYFKDGKPHGYGETFLCESGERVKRGVWENGRFKYKLNATNRTPNDQEVSDTNIMCAICRDGIKLNKMVSEIDECHHIFCGLCLVQYLEKTFEKMEKINEEELPKCPLCRGDIF